MNLPPSIAGMRQFAPLALVSLGAAIAVAAYLQALNYPFASDDLRYITENTKLSGLHLTELWRLFTEPYNPLSEFLPLRELSYWFDMTLFGMNPAVLRVHNILLYLLCLPLLYATTMELWRYFRPTDSASAPWAAALVTALFALHPTLVEAVVCVSGRKYVLPNLFSLLALWLAVRARRKYGLSVPHAAATLVAFAAVMLSKASYVAVAPLIALLWVLFWLDIPKSERPRFLLLWPLVILFLAGLLVWIFIVSSAPAPVYLGIEVITRTLAVMGWLARLAVSPEGRHSFYPVFEDPYLSAMVAIGLAVLVATAAGAVMLLRRRSLEGFALTAFFLLCMPHLQLIPYGASSLVQDRYLTLAVWPVMLLLVALSWRLKPVPRATLLLAIALPRGFQTVDRPRDWRSFEVMVDADLRAYPSYYVPAVFKIVNTQLPRKLHREAVETANRITVYELRDMMIKTIQEHYAVHVDAVAAGRPQEAMAILWKLGLDLKQPPAQAKWNSPIQGVWKYCQFMLMFEWEYLAKHFPDDASVLYNAGLWMLDDHRYINAITYLRAATESQRLPESMRGTAFRNLGLALIGSGQITEAEPPLRAALEQSPPDLRAYCLLSALYKQAGRVEEAARAAASCPSHAPNGGAAQ